jgi:prephenate dehydrogenase
MNLPVNIGIVGMGLIGGSIAKALKQRVLTAAIASIDRDLEEVFEQGVVDILFHSLEELLQWSDLMILASPLSTLAPLAKEIAELCPKEKKLLVIDVGSVKGAVFPCFETLTTENLEFLSTHPMAGKEVSGFTNSDPNLFQDCCWILSPHAKNTKSAIERISSVVKSLGATPTLIDPKKHDRQVALISHLPALLSRSLMGFVQKVDPESLTIAGPGFKSMTRLSHDNPQMQKEISEFNREEIAKQLELFLKFIAEEGK